MSTRRPGAASVGQRGADTPVSCDDAADHDAARWTPREPGRAARVEGARTVSQEADGRLRQAVVPTPPHMPGCWPFGCTPKHSIPLKTLARTVTEAAATDTDGRRAVSLHTAAKPRSLRIMVTMRGRQQHEGKRKR